MKRRIIAGMGANSFGLAITIGIQLLSLPIFLHFWDTSTYGTWIMISAIPAYLSMSDAGMVAAAGNKMTMSIGQGDVVEANKIFQSAQLFMTIACSAMAIGVLVFVMLAPLPGLEIIDRKIALIALCFGVLLALFAGLTETVYTATGKYAAGAILGNLVRLGEWIGAMSGLIVFGSFTGVALSSFTARLMGTVFFIWYSTRSKHGLTLGFRSAHRAEVVALLKPAISFMTFPLANALSFQGVTLLVGVMFGPALVAIFNTYRTIARISVQITAIFSAAVRPEFSRLFGYGGAEAVAPIFRRSTVIGIFQATGMSVILYFISPFLLALWTHGRIQFVPDLMLFMLIYAAIGGIWHVPRSLLMAINQPMQIAQWSLIIGLLVVILAWWFGKYWMLNGVAFSMIISELIIALVATRLAFTAIFDRTQRSILV